MRVGRGSGVAVFAALALSVIALLASAWIAENIYERLPHLEDEMAYAWQARLIAEGFQVSVPSPVCPECFLYPFVVDYNGLRFGKYPLGWPVLLGLGEALDLRAWVNPLLAGWSVWLLFQLGRRLLDDHTALLAAGLLVISPFFLMNSGSLLSHPWSLFLSLAFTLGWLDAFGPGGTRGKTYERLGGALAAVSIGALALTRPLTAVGLALPFAVHGLVIMIRGDANARRRLLFFILGAALVSSLLFLWQYAVTGDPLLNPYTLWWPYDRIGFGPGTGPQPEGHSLAKAWYHTQFSLGVGSSDLFGWPKLSYVFLPFGLWAVRKQRGAWLAAGIPVVLVLVYAAYWVGSWLYGPRYYYEGIFSAALLTAAGIRWLAGRAVGKLPATAWGWPARLRLGVTAGVVLGLALAGARYYTPLRLSMMRGLYQVSRMHLEPFLEAAAEQMPPTLVIVYAEEDWIEYGRLLDLSSPLLDSTFIFTITISPEDDQKVIEAFPERLVWRYHPLNVDSPPGNLE